MRSRTATWFVCGIRYEKTMEDGSEKKVTEQHVIDALSFTEAEQRITEEMSHYISGEFSIKTCALANFREVFFDDADNSDKWYKVKVAFISIDEKTLKEKRSNVNYLVQAASISNAIKNVESVMGGTMIDYVILSAAETPIFDVFEYQLKEDSDANGEKEAEG